MSDVPSDRIQIQTYLTNLGSKFYTALDRTYLPAKSRVRLNSATLIKSSTDYHVLDCDWRAIEGKPFQPKCHAWTVASDPMAHDGQTETFKFEFQTNIMTKQKEMENKTVPKITMTYVVRRS